MYVSKLCRAGEWMCELKATSLVLCGSACLTNLWWTSVSLVRHGIVPGIP